MRRTLMLIVLVWVMLVTAIALGDRAHAQLGSGGDRPGVREMRQQLHALRTHVNDVRRARCHTTFRFQYPAWAYPRARVKGALNVWAKRHQAAHRLRRTCHTSLWLCIHANEGSWTDPNPPYFGGLQMGYWFMGEYGDADTYGRNIYAQEGTADHWSPGEQMGVAQAAYRESGYSRAWLFGQWPNTAPPCA